MWKVITTASNYWRLSQSRYHTCSDQEGDRPWVRIATKGQGLGFMSCSEDISPIYSCAGCCPLLPTPWCKALLTTNPQSYFARAQGAAPSVVSSASSCYFGKTLALLLPPFWGQLQKHTAPCSSGGPTAGSWRSQHCLAYRVWHVPRPSLNLHSAKAYTLLQTHTVSPAVQGSGGKIPWIQEGVISSDTNSNHTNGKESMSFAWRIKINECKGCASPVDICYLFNKRAAGDSWP